MAREPLKQIQTAKKPKTKQRKTDKLIAKRDKSFEVEVLRGRPSVYTDALAAELCARLAQGESLRTVCRDENMPVTSMVFRWLGDERFKDFKEQYARAKEEAADAMAEDILDISDDGSNDWMERNFGNDTVWLTNGEAIQRSKLRVDTRRWLMAKMKPKRYGDKLDMTTNGKDMPTPILGTLQLPEPDQG